MLLNNIEEHYCKPFDETDCCVCDKGDSNDDFHPVIRCPFYKDSREKRLFSDFNIGKSHSSKHLACFYHQDHPILALSRTNMLFKIPGSKEVRSRSGCLLCSELAAFIHYLPQPH
jgi:hypothetical protein